ncbi:MAG: hypothetical protein KDE66_04625 [Nitrosomonas sp.]|nr:hypothetical protein [Nitrosomonas sp.]HQU63040.1 hypothetical protein [Nitrosomonas sp.]
MPQQPENNPGFEIKSKIHLTAWDNQGRKLPLVDKTTAIIESGIGKNNAAYCRIQ